MMEDFKQGREGGKEVGDSKDWGGGGGGTGRVGKRQV